MVVGWLLVGRWVAGVLVCWLVGFTVAWPVGWLGAWMVGCCGLVWCGLLVSWLDGVLIAIVVAPQ